MNVGLRELLAAAHIIAAESTQLQIHACVTNIGHHTQKVLLMHRIAEA
jgi:hypothetical protein